MYIKILLDCYALNLSNYDIPIPHLRLKFLKDGWPIVITGVNFPCLSG